MVDSKVDGMVAQWGSQMAGSKAALSEFPLVDETVAMTVDEMAVLTAAQSECD